MGLVERGVFQAATESRSPVNIQYTGMRLVVSIQHACRFMIGVCILLSLSSKAAAQQASIPEKVVVTHTGDDRVGRSLVFELREAINSSSQMELAEAANTLGGVVISLVTLDPDDQQGLSGTSTIYSATWTFFLSSGRNTIQLYLSSSVGVSGSDRIRSTARDLAATTDELRRRVPGELTEMTRFFRDMQDGSR